MTIAASAISLGSCSIAGDVRLPCARGICTARALRVATLVLPHVVLTRGHAAVYVGLRAPILFRAFTGRITPRGSNQNRVTRPDP